MQRWFRDFLVMRFLLSCNFLVKLLHYVPQRHFRLETAEFFGVGHWDAPFVRTLYKEEIHEEDSGYLVPGDNLCRNSIGPDRGKEEKAVTE